MSSTTERFRTKPPLSPTSPSLLGLLSLGVLLSACGGEAGPAPVEETSLEYAGRAVCSECHDAEEGAWQGSHHDLAMQEANDSTVVGDFEGTSFTHNGTTTTFSRSASGFHVDTEGSDGEMQRYDVAYTFGIEPLQQYLIATERGRVQALSVVWDARPTADGGQRWYHLYPDEEIPPGDVLHWTGDSQNWNYMCADCHSTGLDKGYDPETDTYNTTWEELDVSCEACHGPGSDHVAWARRSGSELDGEVAGGSGNGRYGLTVELGDPEAGAWVINEVTGIAARTSPPPAGQIETCARCHSRRAPLDPLSAPTGDLFDSHAPETLERGLYYADGQILDEVYVWGSFRQSPMYQAGVRCSDCHDPHTAELRAPGNGVCATCHFAPRFDTPEHHFHEVGTEGAECVSCHMTDATYMGVDDRRDHSFRVPRPDVSAQVGAPDACTACHENRSSDWAVARIVDWYGDDRRSEPHYGQTIHAGRTGAAGSQLALAVAAADEGTPAIVRATAVALMAEQPDPLFGSLLPEVLADPDAQVRAIAVRSLDMVPFENRLALAGPLLNDPSLAVRAQAARVLAALPREGMPPGQVRILERATEEYIRALDATLDHPSAHIALARLYADRGRVADAEAALRTALRIGPWFVPGWVNMADLYRSLGRDAEGEALLLQAIDIHPDQASVHYSLGLLLSRAGRTDEALVSLERAALLAPEAAQFAYGYALALNSVGEQDTAIARLTDALQSNPNNRDVLYALATFHRDAGQRTEALTFANRLLALDPGNQALQGLVTELGGGTP